MFGGSLLGLRLGRMLPEDNLSPESKDVVRLSTGIVATMVALVLGLLIASAKGFYDTQTTEITQLAADAATIDRLLAHYGPEARPSRDFLRDAVSRVLDQMWSAPRYGPNRAEPGVGGSEALYDTLERLDPKDDEQRSIKSEALSTAFGMGQLRWLIYVQGATTLPLPLIAALTVWLTLVFISSGLFARPNPTVVASFFAAALSVSGAIWLIWEMYTPYTGIIRIPDAALRSVLSHLGQ